MAPLLFSERCRVAELTPLTLDARSAAVYRADRGTVVALTSNEVASLRRCRELRTIDEHAAMLSAAGRIELDREAPFHRTALWRTLSPLFRYFSDRRDQNVESVREWLGKCLAAGLLETEHALLTRFTANARSCVDDARRIQTVGIPTRNRPRQLHRALNSYWRNHVRVGRRPAYVIVDSSERHISERSRLLSHRLGRRLGIPVTFCGLGDRHALVDQLAKYARVPRHVVSFGLLGDSSSRITTGAARNCLLLLSIGQRALQVDDDTLCSVEAAPTYTDCLVLKDRSDPEMFFVADAQPPHVCDYLATHESLLGRSSASLAARALESNRLDLSQANPHTVGRLTSRTARITVTMSGARGDSGWHSSLPYLLLDEPSWSRLVTSHDSYMHAFEHRQVVRTTRQETISISPICMSLNVGLDNTSLLPPFFPVYRNQDGVFAAVLCATRDGASFGWAPWTVLHAPEPPRQEAREARWKVAGEVRLSDIVISMISEFAHIRRPGLTRSTETLGDWLCGFGSFSDEAFKDLLREHVWRIASRTLAHIEARLNGRVSLPSYAHSDLLNYAERLRALVLDTARWLPADVVADVGSAAALGATRQLVKRFGELLLHWNTLGRGAADLAAQDGLCRDGTGP